MIKITIVKINRNAGNDDCEMIETTLLCTDGANKAIFTLRDCYGGVKSVNGKRTDSQELTDFEKQCDEAIGYKPLFLHGLGKVGQTYEF